MTDLELIAALKNADEAAFRLLIERHQRTIYNRVLHFLRDAVEAEDVAQDVFIEVAESIHTFNAESRLDTWLHRIAIRKCIDHQRAHRRVKRFAVLTRLFGVNDELVVDPADPLHPGIILEDQERSRILFAAIDRLPEKQRIAYMLVRVEESSVKDVAEIMGLTPKAVESLLSRARATLQDLLRSYYLNS